jgi:hypothetical protein
MLNTNTNIALLNQDCTEVFKEIRQEQINPYAKKFFSDILDSLNVKPRKK